MPTFCVSGVAVSSTVTTDTRLERVRTAAQRVAGSCGLDIFDIQLRRESSGWVLRVVIDRRLQREADGAVAPVVWRPFDDADVDVQLYPTNVAAWLPKARDGITLL